MKSHIVFYTIAAFLFMGCSDGVNINKADIEPDGVVGQHEYIDLGLPEGTLWATCNVGASKPEETGDYFAWGETKPKKIYSWHNYKWCAGTSTTLTKYNSWADGDTYGLVDNKDEMEYGDDAAIVNWGDDWRTPLSIEFQELLEGCDWRWIKNYNGSGVSGTIGISKKNGKIIFFPESGYRTPQGLITNTDHAYLGYETPVETEGGFSSYWSSEPGECYPGHGYTLDFPLSYLESSGDHCCYKCYGLCVRAVVNKNPKRVGK